MSFFTKNKVGAILCDLWGVVHNGETLHHGILDLFDFCKRSNICVILFSNAPRMPDTVENYLKNNYNLLKGVNYDGIVTSGEVFVDYSKSVLSGKRCFFYGEEKDLSMIDQILAVKTNLPSEADFVLFTGPLKYEGQDPLHDLVKQNVPGYCINPDLKAIKGNIHLLCAGYFAEQYQNMGGKVKYFGKPHQSMYDYAVKKYDLHKNDLIAIGDSIRTDINGANLFGIRAILVETGINVANDVVKDIDKPFLSIKTLSELMV